MFPYLVLFILLIRGCTLEGHWLGLKFYLEPDWAKLKDPQVWGDAAVQVHICVLIILLTSLLPPYLKIASPSTITTSLFPTLDRSRFHYPVVLEEF